MSESIKKYHLKQLNMLHKAKIQLSAHTIDGWQGQYAIMMRYYKRAIETNNKTDKLDFWIAFFQNCFYVKDWIKNEKCYESKNWNQKLNDLINTNKSMQICRDLCNGSKHLVLSNASIDKHFAIFYEYNPWHKATGEEESEWKIFINGKRFKMSELARDCIEIWNGFIRNEGLLTANK